MHADQQQLRGMAAAFAALPCKVLWRLTPKEVPDESAIAALGLGNNTKVPAIPSVYSYISLRLPSSTISQHSCMC